MRYIIAIICFFSVVMYSAAQQPADCQVKKITVYSNILKRGGNPCYKPSGDTIAYQKSILNLSNLVLSTQVCISDTGINTVTCLTCDTSLLPPAIRNDRYKGNPEYHISGDYIVFTSENENGAHQPWNLPGAGVDHDIFVMNASGTQYWRLTNIPAGYGILHPAFSADGTKLFWAEMYYSVLFPPQGQEYGLWTMKMADFAIVAGVPQISNTVSFAPEDSVWYESHAFSPGGEQIAFTSHVKDSSAYYGDIYIMNTTDIGTTNRTNLTNTPYIHDEHAHWSPGGNKISWMSGNYIGGLETYISELYLMDANGANPMRLTYFTDPSFPEYIQDSVVVADHYWSPDGRKIFGFVHFINSSGWPSELYQLEFMGPCGLDPMAGMETDKITAGNIYPNPAQDICYVTMPFLTNEQVQVEVYSLLGQNVLHTQTQSLQGTAMLDVSALPSGIYVVNVVTEENEVYRQKLIVSHPGH